MPVSPRAHRPQAIMPARFAVSETGRAGGSPEEGTMPQPNRPALGAVMRLHRKYHGVPMAAYVNQLRRRRDMSIFRRPTTGYRMDNAAERKYRREQSPEDLVLEQAQMKNWDQQARIGKHRAENDQPYRGSRLEAGHRQRGRE